MDKRLFIDYLKRWWFAWILAIFFCIVGMISSSAMIFSLYAVGAFIACFYRDFSAIGYQRNFRTLPISTKQFSFTLWFIAIAFPTIVLFSMWSIRSFLPGVSDTQFLPFKSLKHPMIVTLSYSWVILCIAFLSLKWAVQMNWYSLDPIQKVITWVLSIVFGLAAGGSIFLIQVWDKYAILYNGMPVLGSVLFVLSYFMSEKVLEGVTSARLLTPAKTSSNPNAKKVGVIDHLYSNPMYGYLPGSIVIPLIYLLLVGFYSFILNGFRFDGSYLKEIGIPFSIQMVFIFAVIFFSLPFMTSLRLFASLPVSRAQMIFHTIIGQIVIIAPYMTLTFILNMFVDNSSERNTIFNFTMSSVDFIALYLLMICALLFVNVLMLRYSTVVAWMVMVLLSMALIAGAFSLRSNNVQSLVPLIAIVLLGMNLWFSRLISKFMHTRSNIFKLKPWGIQMLTPR